LVKLLLALGIETVTAAPISALVVESEGCVALGIVFNVTVVLAVMVSRYVPEMVAFSSNTAEMLTLFVPSELWAMLPLVTVASFVVLPPLLLMAGEVQVYLVPLMVVTLSSRLPIPRLQELACTRYMTQVILLVLFATFCVADQSTRSL
jgi:hypothetical protein